MDDQERADVYDQVNQLVSDGKEIPPDLDAKMDEAVKYDFPDLLEDLGILPAY